MDSNVSPLTSSRKLPRFLKFRSSQVLILVTICAAAFTDGFVYSIFVPVLPVSLQQRYHIAPENVQTWCSALLGIFGAVVLVGSPIVGWISDGDRSRKGAYVIGLICLTGGIVTLTITTNIWMLVVSRILQGSSAAVVFTVGLALIADTVASSEIGYYMGFALSAMSCGVIVGPVIGSLLFNSGGYMAVVALMIGIAFVDIVLRLLMIEKSEAASYEVTTRETTERTSLLPQTPPESRPMLVVPIPSKWKTFSLLTNYRIATAIYGVFVHVVIIASFDGVLAIFLEQVFGWTTINVALCFLAIALPNTLIGPFAGKLSDTYGPRWPAFLGCILTAVPMILLQLIHQNTKEQVWLLYVLLVSTGAALSLVISPLAADLFHVVETMEMEGDAAAYAQSYGLFTCAMAGGTLVGPVLAGYVKETFGWTIMTWVLGIVIASGAIPVYFFTGSRKRDHFEQRIA